MKMTSRNLNNESWSNTLPTIDYPFAGESLIGYLLRLDYINGFSPGIVLRMCLIKGHKVNITKERNVELIEELIDIKKLSVITNTPEQVIKSMMISQIRKRIYRFNNYRTKELLHYTRIRICPICIQEWKIPIFNILPHIHTCLIHGTQLINQCWCGKNINLIEGKGKLSCHNIACQKNYIDLVEKIDRGYSYYNDQRYYYDIYEDYIIHGISVVNQEENVIRGFIKRINYLFEMRNTAFNYLRESLNVKIEKDDTYERRHHYIFDFLTQFNYFISFLKSHNVTPYDFYSLDICEEPIFEVKLIELGVVKANTICFDDECTKLRSCINCGGANIAGKIEVRERDLKKTFSFLLKYEKDRDQYFIESPFKVTKGW